MKRNNWHGQRYHWYWSPIKSALHTGFVVLVFIALILLMSSTAFSQDYSKAFDAIAAKDGQENALAFQDYVHTQPSTDEEIALCIEAMELCPVEAIGCDG